MIALSTQKKRRKWRRPLPLLTRLKGQPPYPKDLPHFDTVDNFTSYYVFMILRHWKRVEKALADESD